MNTLKTAKKIVTVLLAVVLILLAVVFSLGKIPAEFGTDRRLAVCQVQPQMGWTSSWQREAR